MIEPERPIGHHQLYQYVHYGVPKAEDRERDRKNNGWQLPKFEERDESAHLRLSINTKQDKLKGYLHWDPF